MSSGKTLLGRGECWCKGEACSDLHAEEVVAAAGVTAGCHLDCVAVDAGLRLLEAEDLAA